MDELEPLPESLKQLLDAERPVPKVPAAAKARMLGKLTADLFGPGGGGGGGGQGGGQPHAPPHAPASAATQAASWGTAAVTKLAVGVGVVSFAVGGAVGVGVHAAIQAPPPPTPPPVTAVTPPPKPEPQVVEVVPAPEPVVPVPEPARPPKPPPPSVRGDALGVERSLVDQARSALARQDFASALAALEDHEKRFPRGQLAEERSALKVVALSGVGRHDDAHAAAAAFKARWPDSLLMQLVDSAQ